MKKSSFMFLVGVILLTFFMYCYKTDFSLYNIATDSGFDTSYSGGSSSSSSSSSSSWGSSSGGTGGGSSVDTDTIFGNVILSIFLFIPALIYADKLKKHKKLWIIISSILISLCIVFKIVEYVLGTFMLLLIPTTLISVIVSCFSHKSSKNKITRRKYLPKTEENLKLLEEAYEIFLETQIAWMNFDYEKLREVTTDVLYNTYYNQLQPLKLKEQINVMHDFELIRYEIVDNINGSIGTTLNVELEVKFYDYISNSKGVCIRGNKGKKVHMLYDLTYVYNESAITECPNCNAPLTPETTICSHCDTRISSVRSKMKLSTKKCLRQR